MANAAIKKFRFTGLDEYLWNAQDFADFQQWIYDTISALVEGGFGDAVLKGCNVTPQSGLTLNVPTGIVVNSSGQLMVVPASTATVLSPSGNPARTLIAARPQYTDVDLITDPQDPQNTLYLHQLQGVQLVVLNGIAAATPAYPSLQSGDVALVGVKLVSGQSTVAQADLDFGVRAFKKRQQRRVREISADVGIDTEDYYVEVNCSAADRVATLPDATLVPGGEFCVGRPPEDTGGTSRKLTLTDGGTFSEEITDVGTMLVAYSNGKKWRLK